MGPLDEIEPLVIAEPDGWAEWLLRNNIRQDDMVTWDFQPNPFRKKLRRVAGEDRASALFICLQRFVGCCHGNFLIFDLVGSEEIAKIQRACGVTLDTCSYVIKLQPRHHIHTSTNKKSLPIVICYNRKFSFNGA